MRILSYSLAEDGARFRGRRASSDDFDFRCTMSVHGVGAVQTIQNSVQKTNDREECGHITPNEATSRQVFPKDPNLLCQLLNSGYILDQLSRDQGILKAKCQNITTNVSFTQHSTSITTNANLYSKNTSSQVTERDKITWHPCPPPQRQSKFAFSTTTPPIESNWTATVSDWFAMLIVVAPESFRAPRC